jgi:hypothetical protein
LSSRVLLGGLATRSAFGRLDIPTLVGYLSRKTLQTTRLELIAFRMALFARLTAVARLGMSATLAFGSRWAGIFVRWRHNGCVNDYPGLDLGGIRFVIAGCRIFNDLLLELWKSH